MKRNTKVITISAGLIVLGSAVAITANNATYELNTKPEDRRGLTEAKELNSEIFQDLVAKSGVVLTQEALYVIPGYTIPSEGADIVTAPSMMPLP